MAHNINIPNLPSDNPAQLPVALRPSGKLGDAASSGTAAFEEELTGEQHRVNTTDWENNSYPNATEQRGASKGKGESESQQNREIEGDYPEKNFNGIRHAMHNNMSIFSSDSSEVSKLGKTSLEDVEALVSSPSGSEYQEGETSLKTEQGASLPGSNSVSEPAITVRLGEVEASKHQDAEPNQAELREDNEAIHRNSGGKFLPKAPSLNASEESTAQTSRASALSVSTQNAEATRAKDVPMPAPEAPRATVERSIEPPRPAVSSTSTQPAETTQVKEAPVKDNDAPRPSSEPNNPPVRTPNFSESTQSTQAKDAPAREASRALQGSESSRNVTAPSQNAGAVASRSVASAAQIVQPKNRKDSPRAR
ncbi:MAG: hypothetical protein O7C75_11340, partial [Verrucomicrobia bacterium]|nr:hypothetical protein [Verrucomicrobiota bacterium]